MRSPHPIQCLVGVLRAHSALCSALPVSQALGNLLHASGCNYHYLPKTSESTLAGLVPPVFPLAWPDHRN